LHDRCIQMGKKFACDIIAKSTFSEKGGTKICQKIETAEVKSIVKNENLVGMQIQNIAFYDSYNMLLQNNIMVEALKKDENALQFRIKEAQRNKVLEILDKQYPDCRIQQKELQKLSIVGFGIIQDNQVLKQVMEILEKYKIEIIEINLTQAKIELVVKAIDNYIMEELHERLI